MNKYLKLVVAIIICELAGLLATPFTIAAIPTWYSSLTKPFFSPPNWVFGPVWTLLYFLMGISVFLIWQKGFKNKPVKIAVYWFAAQLVLNFLWSILFFGMQSPILGLLDIVILWILILITILRFYKLSRTAAYLLIPYLAWVTFATILNFSIFLLN